MRGIWMLGVATVLGAALAAMASSEPLARPDDLQPLNGVWVYVEDRTEGKTLEQLGPPMSSTFSFRVEGDAVILAYGHGSGHRDVRVTLDGAVTEVPGDNPGAAALYRGAWKDGVFTYEVEFVRPPGQDPGRMIRRDFRMTEDGLLVRFNADAPGDTWWVGLYRHAEDIAMPTPAKAAIGDVAWLAGAWVGTRGSQGQISFEERWSPPLGGSMFATSRTVNRGKLSAFEYLRIVERDSGLVYIAQPNGGTATEFVLTELGGTRAVFDNPRHDYPKRIVYEVSAEGGLSATIGFMKGGSPRRFEFKRE